MLSRDRKKDQESNCGFDVSVRKDMVDGTCSVDQQGATTTAVNTVVSWLDQQPFPDCDSVHWENEEIVGE